MTANVLKPGTYSRIAALREDATGALAIMHHVYGAVYFISHGLLLP